MCSFLSRWVQSSPLCIRSLRGMRVQGPLQEGGRAWAIALSVTLSRRSPRWWLGVSADSRFVASQENNPQIGEQGSRFGKASYQLSVRQYTYTYTYTCTCTYTYTHTYTYTCIYNIYIYIVCIHTYITLHCNALHCIIIQYKTKQNIQHHTAIYGHKAIHLSFQSLKWLKAFGNEFRLFWGGQLDKSFHLGCKACVWKDGLGLLPCRFGVSEYPNRTRAIRGRSAPCSEQVQSSQGYSPRDLNLFLHCRLCWVCRQIVQLCQSAFSCVNQGKTQCGLLVQ